MEQRIAEVSDQGRALLAALREKIAMLQLGGEVVVIPSFESAKFTLEQDLYNGKQTLMGSFYPSPYYRAGFLLFHSDGSCFAEYHVMQIHPTRPHMFIEAVEAWKYNEAIKTDFRLMSMPA